MQDPRPETPREGAQRRLQSIKTGVVVASVASLVGFVGVAATHGGGSADAAPAPGAPAAAPAGTTRYGGSTADGGWGYPRQTPSGAVPGDASGGQALPWPDSSTGSTGTAPSQDGGYFGAGGPSAPVGSSGAS